MTPSPRATVRPPTDAAQLLAAVVESSADAIIAKTLSEEILAWNRGAEEMYGYSADEAVGSSIELIVPPDRRDELTAIMERVRAGSGVTLFETVRRRKDGTDIAVALTVSPVFDAEGRIVAASAIARDITERKAAERALAESERRFRRLVENARDVVTRFRLHPDLGYEYVSPSVTRALGYEPAEFYRRPDLALDLVHPDDRKLLRRAVDEAWSTPFTLRLLHRDGRVVWAERSQAVVRDAAGRPVAIEAITRDVTAQREASRAIEESERQLRAVFEGALDALLIADDDRVCVRANRAAADLFGVSAEEVVGRRIDELVGAGGTQAVEGTWEGLIGAGRQYGEFTIPRPDGEGRRAEFAATAAILPGRHLFALRDITERRRAEAELERAEALYRKVVENSKDLIALFDPTGTVTFASPSHAEALGYAPAEVVGRKITDFVHADDLAAVGDLVGSVLQGAPPDSLTARLVRADGEIIHVEGTATPIVNGDGRPKLILVTSRDVSSRVRAEQLEERLRAAEKLEAIGKLAGGIAHDFNNLLMAINGYSDAALNALGEGEGPVREKLEEIRHAGERAAELTRQLLAFGRQQVLVAEPTDLNAVVGSSEAILRRLLGEDVRILLDLTPDLPAALADSGQLMQVVLNLCLNARDSMPDGGDLRLETRTAVLGGEEAELAGVEPGRYVVLRVSDSGEGMDSAVLEHIFEPFFTTKEPGEGTGLGLSTVHGIVKQTGGGVACVSEPGEGTTFTVFLPVSDDEARREEPLTCPPERGSGRVLLVEDEPMIRDVMELMLRDLGYEVRAVGSPNEAVDLVRADTGFDLLLTDVVMPQMNGHQLACRIRELCPPIRVVYTSGYTGDVVLTRGVLAEDDHFLQKPFTQLELARTVSEVLHRAA